MGFANTGGTTHCNLTICGGLSGQGLCHPELDSQNAAISWGPLTAANLVADYQVIAWSGAGFDEFPAVLGVILLPNATDVPDMPDQIAETCCVTA